MNASGILKTQALCPTGAFKPEAVFSGAMGTITMSAAASDADHPCSQGSLPLFLTSLAGLTPGTTFDNVTTIITICYGLFAL